MKGGREDKQGSGFQYSNVLGEPQHTAQRSGSKSGRDKNAMSESGKSRGNFW